MKVLVAIDSLKGSLSSRDAAEAVCRAVAVCRAGAACRAGDVCRGEAVCPVCPACEAPAGARRMCRGLEAVVRCTRWGARYT